MREMGLENITEPYGFLNTSRHYFYTKFILFILKSCLLIAKDYCVFAQAQESFRTKCG